MTSQQPEQPARALTLAEARQAAAKATQDAQDARRRVAELEAAEEERLRLLGIGEPEGHPVGYVYAALLLGNGAEIMAKRSPNSMWWWENDFCGECRKWGTWDELLACVKPARVVPLKPVTVTAVVPAPGCAEGCDCGDDCHRGPA
jgi:hypothetical protein